MIPEPAVKTVAKHMAETALDWTDVEAEGHEHNLECTNWEAYTGDARTALEAALPHIRAMIEAEVNGRPNGFTNVQWHLDAWADTGEGYSSTHGWHLRCLWCSFTASARLKKDATELMEAHMNQIAEGGKP